MRDVVFFVRRFNENSESKCTTSCIYLERLSFKETKSATMNIFLFFFYFLFKSFVKVELSYVFTINLFTIAENCTESELSYKIGVFFSCW